MTEARDYPEGRVFQHLKMPYRAENNIVIDVKTADEKEFVDNYKEAVFEVMTLVFERRELDLCESQLYAMHLLILTAQKMKVQTKFKKY